jgi:hypothetical protein
MDNFENPEAEPEAQPAPANGAPPDDPYGLRSLTFADIPSLPGDGVLTGVLRQMAANGHPGLQDWATKDAAKQLGAGAQGGPQPDSSFCYTRPMTVTAYDNHGPGKDWTYWKDHPEGVGPGTVAVANTDPQPYPFWTTFTVRNPDGSMAYAGTALDTGRGWDARHHNVDPEQWIDIWLPNGKIATQWGVQRRDVEICEPPKVRRK